MSCILILSVFFCVVLLTSEVKTASSLVKTTSVMSASADSAAGAPLTSSGSLRGIPQGTVVMKQYVANLTEWRMLLF